MQPTDLSARLKRGVLRAIDIKSFFSTRPTLSNTFKKIATAFIYPWLLSLKNQLIRSK